MPYPAPVKEPMFRMSVSLRSSMSQVGAMAAGTYWAIVDQGLALPTQRAIAEKCGYSAATLSRRLQRRSLDDLVRRMCEARAMTFPWTTRPAWDDWLPDGAEDRADAHVWSACQQVAVTSPTVAEAVNTASRGQRDLLSRLTAGTPEEVDALHALIEGLTLRVLIDPEFDHPRAVAVLAGAAGSWRAGDSTSGGGSRPR